MTTSISEQSISRILFQLWQNLTRKRRKQLFLLLILILASTLAEVISLAAVLPFLAVIANPTSLWNNEIIKSWAPTLGIYDAKGLLLFITIVFASAAIGAALIRLMNLWASAQLGAAIGSDLACEAYKRTLYQSYSFHTSRNTSTLIATITDEIGVTVGQVISPLLILISSCFILLGLTITLIIIDWAITLGSTLIITLLYLISIGISKNSLANGSKKVVRLNRSLLQTLHEGLGAIRDVLLDGSQKFYSHKYELSDRPLRKVVAKNNFLVYFPRLVLEPLGLVLIALIGYILVLQGGVTKALPLLGALALGAQRLLPMAQKIYEGIGQVRAGKESLANVLELISQPIPEYANLGKVTPLDIKNDIRFVDVCFNYTQEGEDTIKAICLTIKKGERIGIVGETGGGKSTTIDLLMGLLKPSKGKILIDGIDLHDANSPERIASWRASIAHVPQNIYLTDNTISENIAFGLPKELIDLERVYFAARKAQIDNFIEDLHQGYSTHVGEQGVRLSGGQRQRIAIARAIYKNAQILVFDEATSALDNRTESALMKAIDSLKKDLTIVMIAHRVQSLVGCEKIIRIENGIIKYEGDNLSNLTNKPD